MLTFSDSALPIQFVDESRQISHLYTIVASPDWRDAKPPEDSSSPAKAASTAEVITDPIGVVVVSSSNPITSERDAFYMARYVKFIGPWFDLFDNSHHHFSEVVPQLALNNEILLLACLAAAARQHLLVTGTGQEDALTYYNNALRTLSTHLEASAHEPATFASCLLIAHCEMIESKAGNWNLHLRGTRELVITQGWHGQSGGLAQACFWIYCRMMILSSLSSGTPTPISTSYWLPPAGYQDPPVWTVDTWANKTVFLLGTVHNFRCRTRHQADAALLESHESERQRLLVQIRRHELACPMICRPLSAVSRDAWEAVGYANGSVAAAWQMYHTLLLVHATSSTPVDGISTLPPVTPMAANLASKIVANSVTNRSGTAWVNAVQLLTTAGQHLVEPRVRKACVAALEDIRADTGWDTTDSLAMLGRMWEAADLRGSAAYSRVQLETAEPTLPEAAASTGCEPTS